MPLYEYKCEGCGEVFEKIEKFADEPLKVHDKCGGPVHRLMSAPAFQFKGTGWYVTDYAKGGSAPKGESDKNDSGKGESGKGESGKSDGAKVESGKSDSSSKNEPSNKKDSPSKSASSDKSSSDTGTKTESKPAPSSDKS